MRWSTSPNKHYSGSLSSRQVTGHDQASYTEEELEFLRAVQRLKKKYPFPTWNQVLQLVKELGYHK